MAAWATGAVSVAGFAAAWILAARNRDLSELTAVFGPDRFLVAYAVIGTVVAARKPANPIGWLLLGIGMLTAARAVAGEYVLYALAGPVLPGAAVWAAWFINWSLSLVFPAGVLVFLLLLFPTGRPLSTRWRAVGWLAAGLTVVALLLTWLKPGPIVLMAGLPTVPNPTGTSAITVSRPLGDALWLLGWLPLLLAAASLLARYRRSGEQERLQLRWFAYAAAVTVAVTLGLAPWTGTGHVWQWAFDAAVIAGFGLALPLAIGIAVLKYRLYAIDRIVSRVISYAIITAVLAGLFAGLVILATGVLPARTPVAVAAATLAAAALFNPLRKRVQRMVDRRFNRSHYNAEAVVASFHTRLRQTVDLGSVQRGLIDTVYHAFEPACASVWLAGVNGGRGSLALASLPGEDSDVAEADAAVLVPAELHVADLVGRDHDLAAPVIRQDEQASVGDGFR